MIEVYRYLSGELLSLKTWKFPTGETGIKFEDVSFDEFEPVRVEVKFESNDDIVNCLQVVSALNNLGLPPYYILVDFNYLPYSRQDRVCHVGEAFSLEVILQVLKTMQVTVRTLDVHSKIALDLGKNFLIEIPQFVCAASLPKFDVLIAPDRGAATKVDLHLQDSKTVILNKQRIGSKIVYMDYEFDTIQGDVCVVDDLCDGGGTFLALADMLKRTQPGIQNLSLYITHGFFTAGIDSLKEKYNNIYCRNVMSNDLSVKNFVKEI